MELGPFVVMLALSAISYLAGYFMSSRPRDAEYCVTITADPIEKDDTSGVSIHIDIKGTGPLDRAALAKEISDRVMAEVNRRVMDKLLGA